MTRKKNVLLGAGVAVVLVMGGWGLWSIRPLTRTKTWQDGDRFVTEEYVRAVRWLPASDWGFRSWSEYDSFVYWAADGHKLGVIEVIESRTRSYAPTPDSPDWGTEAGYRPNWRAAR